MKPKTNDSYFYDWRNNKKKGFPYKGLNDPRYIKERDEFLKANGNGWWWYQGLMSDEMYKRKFGMDDGEPTTADKYNEKWLREKQNG